MVGTVKEIAPGITRALTRSLEAFIDHAKTELIMNPEREVCGLFLFHPERWEPGVGWIGDVVYHAMENTATRLAEFAIEPEHATDAVTSAMDSRVAAITAACTEHGWSKQTPWVIVAEKEARGHIAKLRRSGQMISASSEQDFVEEAVSHEGGRLAKAWLPACQMFITAPMEWRARGAKSDLLPGQTTGISHPGATRPFLSAEEYLAIKGPNAIVGMGHSHPSGNAKMSPQDYLSTSVVDAWRRLCQMRLVSSGQIEKSEVEQFMFMGNWIYAPDKSVELSRSRSAGSAGSAGTAGSGTATGGWLKSSGALVQYDARGMVGEWKGPF